MSDHRNHHLIGNDFDQFTPDQLNSISKAVDLMLNLFQLIPLELRESVMASICISVMVHDYHTPAAAWTILSKQIADGLQTAIAITESEGTA